MPSLPRTLLHLLTAVPVAQGRKFWQRNDFGSYVGVKQTCQKR
jgi:hypothetical protein